MTRTRLWTFAALVAVVLVANLALVSARFAQTVEEGLASRLTVASGGLRTQIELVDLRSSPRIAAFNPELIEATKPGADASQQPSRPDERALRAAAAALQPEPDLLVVATAHAAAVSRRGKAASLSEDPARLPLIRIALEGGGASPQFVPEGGKLYRAAAARIPGNAAVVLTGTLIDDRFAAQLRSLVDADVTFLQQGAVVASSLPPDDRAALAAWAKAPAGAGFGALRVALPYVGTRFSEHLPLGAPRAATRAALAPLAQGIQGAVSVPAAPHLAWLARYQAFYAAGWALFVLAAFVSGLFAGSAPRAPAAGRPAPAPSPARARKEEAQARAEPAASEAPWSDEPVSAPRRSAARRRAERAGAERAGARERTARPERPPRAGRGAARRRARGARRGLVGCPRCRCRACSGRMGSGGSGHRGAVAAAGAGSSGRPGSSGRRRRPGRGAFPRDLRQVHGSARRDRRDGEPHLREVRRQAPSKPRADAFARLGANGAVHRLQEGRPGGDQGERAALSAGTPARDYFGSL